MDSIPLNDKFCDDGAREMIFGSFDSRDDGEQSSTGLTEISEIFALHFVDTTSPFDGVNY